MTEIPFTQVDAFVTDQPFSGNPAAVMPLDAWLDDATLQAIGLENNLSETAFTIPAEGDADYELRWFTPTSEVALCGHATLATAHVILGDRDEIRFRTRKAGVLTVRREGEAYALSLPAWAPDPKPMPETAHAIGVTPAETLWHPGRYAVLVYADEAEVRGLTPDFAALKPIGDILYICTAPGDATDIVTRCFAPGAGIDEDPVTGSAHAVIAPYWATRLEQNCFTALQASARGGHLRCTIAGDRVILDGKCATVIEGTFRL